MNDFQAENADSKKFNLWKKVSWDSTSNTIQNVLVELTSGVMSSRILSKNMENLTPPENQQVLSSSKDLLKNCDYAQIENNISSLTNETIDLVFNVTVAVQSILDKSNECASEGFPQSLSCFLQLVNTCKVDIEQIKEAVRDYAPVARGLALNIISKITACYFS